MQPRSSSPVAACTRVRSTLLVGSLHALRLRGHDAAYVECAGAALHHQLALLGAPGWVPLALAEAHYAACDRMGLGATEILAIGAAVAPTSASGIQVVLRGARAGGVTPWTALANLPRYWGRMYEGSAARIEEVGPKDALVVVEGTSLARFAYWRIGLRGIIGELAQALCQRAYARELPRRPSDGVTYSLAWV